MWTSLRSLVTAALLLMVVTGCGNSDSTKAKIRLLNASLDYPSVDLFLDDEQKIAGVGTQGIGGVIKVDADSYEVAFKTNGASGKLRSFTKSFKKDSHTTYIAYGRTGHFSTIELNEDTDTPSSGNTLVRVINTASDAGAVDVYITDSNEALSNTSPIFSSVSAGSASGEVKLSSNNYRLRVTAAGSTSDIRLDTASIALYSKTVQTLIIADTPSGFLVNAMNLVQQGDLTLYSNANARVRAVIATSSGNSFTTSLGGTTLLSAASSASVGSYKQLTAGTLSTSLTVDGNSVTVSNQSVSAGHDYTLLVWDQNSSKQLTLINDDNRLPLASDGVKVRLLNGASALAAPATLSVDFSPVIENVAVGSAASFVEMTSTSDSRLDITNASTSTTLYTQTGTSLLSQGVYTMFLFGDASSPSARLRKER